MKKNMFPPILLALLFPAACYTHGAEQTGCQRLISESHLRDLVDMRDSQMITTCKQSVRYVDKDELGNTECFLKAAYRPITIVLNNIEFKKNTPNSKKLDDTKTLHLRFRNCFDDHYDEESKLSERCIKSVYLTAEELLGWVHDYFSEAKQFLSHATFTQDCSSVFQKCSDSQGKETTAPGVVTDRDCKCPATSPIYGGGSASLPNSGPFSSMADQLDSKETAASTLQLPDTTQTQGGSEGSTRPRVLRSTHMSQGTSERMDFRADAVMSPSLEELALGAVSQGRVPLPMNTAASLLDQTIILRLRLKNVPPSPSSQQHAESMEIKSPSPGSGAGSSQTWPNELPSQHSPLSGVARSSVGKQWLQTRETDEAIPRLASDWDRTVTSSPSSLTQPSFASLEPVDGSGQPSRGSWVTLSPSDPELFHVLGSEDPVSATQHPPRLVVTTESSSSTPVGSYSWGQQGSRGKAPGVQGSTQLRERRAEREEGLAQGREPEDSMPGPSFDQSFLPLNTDKHFKKSEPRDTQGMAVTYVTVASVLGILLAVGGLLFYLHRSRISARRRLQRNVERAEEGRPLNGREELVELQIQEEL